MAKETVRYPDALVARIEAFVNDSTAFESKSEYHRFASEYLLSLLDPEHQPSVLGYREIFEDLDTELDEALDDTAPDEEPFLETYVRVRRHLLRGEPDEARAVVDETYAVTDLEAVLLDELIGQSNGQTAGAGLSNGRTSDSDAATASEPSTSEERPATSQPTATDGLSAADGGRERDHSTAVGTTETIEPVESDGGQRDPESTEPVESEY